MYVKYNYIVLVNCIAVTNYKLQLISNGNSNRI